MSLIKYIKRKKIVISKALNYLLINNSNKLINYHFLYFSEPSHINKSMFSKLLEKSGNRPLNIFETGSSAWGTNSSLLFNNYVNKFGGRFVTVDLRKEPSKFLEPYFKENSEAYTDDSVNFIKTFDKKFFQELDIIYLDSFDLDLSNPTPSMKHGLEEFLLLDKLIKKNTLVAIDDTPKDIKFFNQEVEKIKIGNRDLVPGKGALVIEKIANNENYEIIYHEYSIILKKL